MVRSSDTTLSKIHGTIVRRPRPYAHHQADEGEDCQGLAEHFSNRVLHSGQRCSGSRVGVQLDSNNFKISTKNSPLPPAAAE